MNDTIEYTKKLIETHKEYLRNSKNDSERASFAKKLQALINSLEFFEDLQKSAKGF